LQSSQVAFHEKYSANGLDIGEDLGFLDDMGDDAGDGMDNLGDIFGYLDDSKYLFFDSNAGSTGINNLPKKKLQTSKCLNKTIQF
jgi:hypothetical protein